MYIRALERSVEKERESIKMMRGVKDIIFSSMKKKRKSDEHHHRQSREEEEEEVEGDNARAKTANTATATATMAREDVLTTPPSSSLKRTDFAGRIGGVLGGGRGGGGTFSTKRKKKKPSLENNNDDQPREQNATTTSTKKKKYLSSKDFLTASAKKKRKSSMEFRRSSIGSSPGAKSGNEEDNKNNKNNVLSPAPAQPWFASPMLGPPSCLISPNGGEDFIVTHKSPNSVAFEKHLGGGGECEDGHYLSGSPVASGKILERKEKKTSLSPLSGKVRQFPSLGGVGKEGEENDRVDEEDGRREIDRKNISNAEKKGEDDHRGAPVVSSSPSISISDGEENVDGKSEENAKRREKEDLAVDVEKEGEIYDDEEKLAVETWLRDTKMLRQSGQSMNEDRLKAAPKSVMEALGISNDDDDDDAMIVNDAPFDYGYDDDNNMDDDEDDDFGGNYMNGDDDDMINEEKEEEKEQPQQQEHEILEGSKSKDHYPHPCSKCKEKFLSKYKLKVHLDGPCGKIDEKKNAMNSNECSKCGKVCKNATGRIRHEQSCPGKEELERRAREEDDRKAEELQRREEKAEERKRAKEEEERMKEAKREEARRVEEQKKSELVRQEKETRERAAAVKQTLAEARLFEALETDRDMSPASAISRVIREKLLKATSRAAMLDDEECSDNDTTENYTANRTGLDDDALTASMRRTRDDLVKQLEPTVTGHEDSIAVCLSGARGVGKTAIVEAALAKLQRLNNQSNNINNTTNNRKRSGNQQQNDVKIPVVRLSGLLHAEDNIGMREVARQLRPSYQMWDDEEMDNDEAFDIGFVDDIVFSTNAAGGTANNGNATNKVASNMRENYNFVEETLRLLEGAKKTAVFVLDDFDLFARKGKKQTFLYSLLDLLQQKHAQIAIIAITSRHDVEEALEKRVKSRFTARYCVIESQTCIPPLLLDERTGKPLKDRATGKEIVDDESITRNPAQFEEFLAERVRNCLKVSAQVVPPATEKRDLGVTESNGAIPGILFSEHGKLVINMWNAAVDEAINTPLVKTRLQAIATLDNVPRTASDLAIAALMAYQSRTLFSTTALLDDNNDNINRGAHLLSPSDLALALKDFTRNDFVENLKSCSLLELLLCVAAYRLHFTRERFHFTIAALTQELHEMGSVEQLGTAKNATDGVVARSFETLLRMKLVRIVKRSSGHSSSYSSAAAATAPSAGGNFKRAPTSGTASGAKDWKGIALMCTEKELVEAIEGHPSKLSSLKELLRHENVATAVACAL